MTQSEERTISQILQEHLDLKGLSSERVVQMSGIPDRYIKALIEGDAKRLPAAPYVHAYLKRLAIILDASSDDLIRIYDKEAIPPRSGITDALPQNRFAIEHPVKLMNKKMIIIAAIALALLIYLSWGASRLFGIPDLTVTSPAGDMVSNQATMILRGIVSKGDMLTINNNEIIIQKDGGFEKEYPLDLGLNTIEFRAKRFLGKTIIVTRRILYEPQISTTTKP